MKVLMSIRFHRNAVLAVVAATLCAISGMAPAHAEPVAMAAKRFDKLSRDGWQLNIRLDRESVNSVPNLANAANSREGFVTVSGTATATGGSNPITDSIFILGYQLGCQSDVSTGLQIGGTAGLAPAGSVGIGGGLPSAQTSVPAPGSLASCKPYCSRA